MAEATVGSMLDSAKEFETVLVDFLRDLRDRVKNDNTRLLTYYVARHKRHIEAIARMFPPEKLEEIRRIPLKAINSRFISERCFQGTYLASDASARELLDTAIELIDVLLCFYEWLAGQPAQKGADELIDSLINVEEKGLRDLKNLVEKHVF